MNVIYWLAFLCLIGLNVKAQNKTWKPEFQVNTSYNAYFQQAYGIYDRVPKGILEAISYTQTRIRHIQPKMEQASCIGMPLPTGVMGLFEDGKNYFRSNFKLVQSYSGFSAQELRQNPAAQIMAYAKTYQKLLTEFNIQSNNIQDHIPVLIALSELPTASLLEDFAMDSYLYAVLSIWNDPDFAKQMLYECPKIDLEQIFGPNYYILSASYVTASDSKIQGGGFTYNPYLSASNKTASVDYPSAIWDPTTCNYSSRNGTAITHYTIHTVQGTYSGAISWFKNCSANASAHYVIRSSDGQVTQMVREADKAWHVGSENPYTIGTEHEGYVSDPAWYTTAMYNSSAALARDIVNSGYGISGLRTYDGPSSSVVTSTSACIKIKGHQHYPNQTHTDPGINWDWAKFYTLVNNNPTVTTLTNASGSITDPGGHPGNYGNDVRQCILIAPTGASKVTLSFTVFDLESNNDYLWVFDGDNPNATLIGKYTGSTIPPTLTANSGKMFLDFRTDCATVKEGFVANYSAVVADVTPPTTSVNAISGYKTTDFTATFTDNDNVAATTLLYLAAYHDGTNWTANPSNGFMFNEFNSITGWSTYSGSWAISSGALNQTNNSLDNTNLYTSLTQDNASSYLYHFTMNIGGTGTNRRAGLHFFCDNANLANRGNSYFVFFRPDQSKVQIYETISDVFYLRNDITYALSINTTYDVKILYAPSSGTIKVYLNNNYVGQWVDTTPLTSGNYVSFRTGNATAIFDNLRVYKSRAGNSVTVSVGSASNKDIRNSNLSTTSNSCRIFSIVKDNAELWSTVAEGSVAIDFTAPAAVSTVNDGTGTDISVTTNGSQLSANWAASSDENSGILRYEYAIGTTAGGTNIVNWTSNGTSTSVTRTGLTLTNNTTYYFSVRVVNGAGLISSVTSSNGQTYQAPVTCATDTFETNNTMSAAYSTVTGVNRTGLICPQGDVDWFKFTNSSTYPHIRVSLSNLPLDYDMELYNSSGQLVGSSTNSGTSNEVIIYNNAPVGTYYVKIYGYNNNYHSSSRYYFLAQRWSTPWSSKTADNSDVSEDIPANYLQVYPNPTKGKLFIDFTSNALGKAHLKAFNLNGQLVYSQQNEVNEGYNAMEINVNEWVPGIYFLEITTESGEVSRTKFVVSE
jgi:N-acetyl-anhydromuramyl-L-alanine amidase AmpD